MARKRRPGFHGDFAARWNGNDGRPLRILRTFEYVSQDGRVFTIPAEFTTDLASVPRAARSLAPSLIKSAHAAVLHDFLYATHLVERREADALFFEALAVEGVGAYDRWKMWAAVRLFGRQAYGSAPRFLTVEAPSAVHSA